MSPITLSEHPTDSSLELIQPLGYRRYGLDQAAQLAGVSRRVLLIYCRAGLVRPVVRPPYGVLEFTEQMILAMRRLERLRTVHGLDVSWLKTMAAVLEEVEHLRTELRFWRGY